MAVQPYAAIFSAVIGINAGAIVDLEVFVSRRHEHTGLHIHRVGQSLALTGSQGTNVIGEAVVEFAVMVRICDGQARSFRTFRNFVLAVGTALIEVERGFIVGQIFADGS